MTEVFWPAKLNNEGVIVLSPANPEDVKKLYAQAEAQRTTAQRANESRNRHSSKGKKR